LNLLYRLPLWLIVPISQFIEKSFENWTRYSSDLIGAVYLQMDWTVPFETLREYYGKILADSPLWDGKTSIMQVTDSTKSTVEIRFLMSAQSASAAFELRCYVREKMLSYLQKELPESLPKVRTEVSFTGKPIRNYQHPAMTRNCNSPEGYPRAPIV
jgi:hypothetical protein